MIHPRFVAVLATAAALILPGAAFAATPAAVPQTAYQAAPAATPPQGQVQGGIAVSDVRDWLVSVGATVGEVVHADGHTSIKITDGPLSWLIFFNSCEADVCGDIQYMAVFSNATITPDLINQWNRDHRFLKAYFTPGASAGTAVVQYDLVLLAGVGIDQLVDPTSVWVGLLPAFATHVGFFAPETAPAQ